MKGETVFRAVIERAEERNSLNMVPVKMGDENVGANGAAFEFTMELLAQRAEPGAAVEDIQMVAETRTSTQEVLPP